MTRDRAPSNLIVSEFMTPAPHCIGVDQTLELAAERMAELHVRHMPVRDGGQLVGVLSDRDIALIRAVVADRVGHMTVEEAMTAVPYCVLPDTPVAEVARHMATRKLGCALVVDKNERIEGVFTTTDALELLANVLDDSMPEPRTKSRLQSIDVPSR